MPKILKRLQKVFESTEYCQAPGCEKPAIYARYGLNLVELADGELENLDDNLARLLLPFGGDCT